MNQIESLIKQDHENNTEDRNMSVKEYLDAISNVKIQIQKKCNEIYKDKDKNNEKKNKED